MQRELEAYAVEARDPSAIGVIDDLTFSVSSVRGSGRAAAAGDLRVQGHLADLLAYRAFVEGLREWPFDTSTLVRFALYTLIPVGSWLGGAFVERLLDRLLA